MKKLTSLLILLTTSLSYAESPEGIGDCTFTSGNFAPGLPGGNSGWIGHPCPQPRPGNGEFFGSMQSTSDDGMTTFVVTPEGQHQAQDPFDEPPGSNFLMTVNSNLYDFNGDEMPNTQPSSLDSDSYMLHDGSVILTDINPQSPSEDLDEIIDQLELFSESGTIDFSSMSRALGILEGTPIANRAYSGFPMLHYNGPNKIKVVEPICANDPCQAGDEVIGGNVDVNMLFWDQHIESDAAFIDPSAVQEVPWTITYHVKVLTGGIEDFSPMTMHFDQTPAGGRGPFHASMDQSYFPMLEEGKDYEIKIKQSLGKYYNLTYTWGWRIHPPRVQVSENALKMAMSGEPGVGAKTLPQWEIDVFGENPMQNFVTRYAAINKIGNISPAKRMWNNLHYLRVASIILNQQKNSSKASNGKSKYGNPKVELDKLINGFKSGNHAYLNQKYKKMEINKEFDIELKGNEIFALNHYLKNNKSKSSTSNFIEVVVADLRSAYLDWTDRTRLPAGVEPDPDATITLLYANNTIYGSRQGLTGKGSGLGAGSYKGVCNGCAHDWLVRPYTYKVTLYNGDHFVHGYMNVDFGGTRGWENQFQQTDPTTALAEHIHDEATVIIGDRTDIINGEVVVSEGNVIIDTNILLDLTSNQGKADLAIDLSTGERVYTDENIFPMNTGGTEEFLKESPRNLDDPDNGSPLLGSGCFFTFGRNYAWPSAGGPWGPIFVPAVSANGVLGKHKVEIEYNFEPSRRLKIYQFDPLHHDVAIYSLH